MVELDGTPGASDEDPIGPMEAPDPIGEVFDVPVEVLDAAVVVGRAPWANDEDPSDPVEALDTAVAVPPVVEMNGFPGANDKDPIGPYEAPDPIGEGFDIPVEALDTADAADQYCCCCCNIGIWCW